MKNIIIFVAVGAIAIGGWFYFNPPEAPVVINNFEECAALYPVMESYPEQCATPEGQNFVRDISNDKPMTEVDFDRAFTLLVGGRVVFPNGLMIDLPSVGDSRCKEGVQCIWAGELNPNLVVKGAIFKKMDSIRLGTITATQVIRSGYSFNLETANPVSATLIVRRVPIEESPAGIVGWVHFGPTCPAQQDPPDANCKDKAFMGADVTISSGEEVVKTLKTDLNGGFRVELAPGEYIVNVEPANGAILPRCNPETVQVLANSFAELDVSCDSGIR